MKHALAGRSLDLSQAGGLIACGYAMARHRHFGTIGSAMTREVAKAAETLGLTVHDHIVIGRAGHASFKGMGLL